MVIRNTKDFWAGALFAGLGAATVLLSRDYEFGIARRMGPGYFPTVLGFALILLGLAIVLKSLTGPRDAVGPIAFGPMASILGGTIAFGLLLVPAGVIIATLALVLIASMTRDGAKLPQALILGLCLAGGSAAVFSWLLGQPLPILGSWLSG